MKIQYSQLPGITSKTVLAPMLPVTILYSGNDFSGLALVDSGATGGVISTSIAEKLEIQWEKIPLAQGFSVGGLVRSHHVENLTVETYGHSFFCSLSVVEGISPYKIILGQADLFHQAKITFEEYKKQFEIDFRRLN